MYNDTYFLYVYNILAEYLYDKISFEKETRANF